MAKKKNIQTSKPKKLTAEERLHYENLSVLATAIALISGVVLLYLYRYLTSTYILQTQTFISVLIWICDAVILGCVGMYFWKKDKKFLNLMIYFVAGGTLLTIIRYFHVIKNFFDIIYVSKLWNGLMTLLHIQLSPIATAFWFVYICLAVYLIATYIYCGIKLRKVK